MSFSLKSFLFVMWPKENKGAWNSLAVSGRGLEPAVEQVCSSFFFFFQILASLSYFPCSNFIQRLLSSVGIIKVCIGMAGGVSSCLLIFHHLLSLGSSLVSNDFSSDHTKSTSFLTSPLSQVLFFWSSVQAFFLNDPQTKHLYSRAFHTHVMYPVLISPFCGLL